MMMNLIIIKITKLILNAATKLPLLGLLILSVCLTGCQSETQTTTDKTVNDQLAHPNYLRLPLNGRISSIDPSQVTVTDGIELTEQLFLNLTDFDPNTDEPQPELATHWQHNAAGDRYTFYLRKDALWQNGRAVTAHDVVWSIQHNLDPVTKSAQTSLLFVLKNARAIHSGDMNKENLGVRALDDYTVEFELTHPLGSFPALLSLNMYTPLPREVIETHGENWTKAEFIIGNAAYQVTE